MNLYFTYAFRDTLTSFTLLITVKPVAKLNLGHRYKFEIEFYKISRRSYVKLPSTSLVRSAHSCDMLLTTLK